MPYVAQVDKEIMEDVLYDIDPREAYSELWRCIIVKTEAKLDELLSPTWR
jgi:hypothetical protein